MFLEVRDETYVRGRRLWAWWSWWEQGHVLRRLGAMGVPRVEEPENEKHQGIEDEHREEHLNRLERDHLGRAAGGGAVFVVDVFVGLWVGSLFVLWVWICLVNAKGVGGKCRWREEVR